MDTLYPKITGKQNEFVARLGKLGFRPGTIELIGTVKLHGAHADIVIDSQEDIRFQSRNALSIDPGNDNYGFVASMRPFTNKLLDLKNQYHARYAQLNPQTPIDPQYPLIIGGEWIGRGIQKNVAISGLNRSFVIISVNVNGTWQPDELYADVQDESAGIYNISRGGFYYQSLSLDPPGDKLRLKGTASFAAMQETTDAIDKVCPFASSFDITGTGEGIVWKPRYPPFSADPKLWYKTKGRTHLGVQTSRKAKSAKQVEQVTAKEPALARAQAFAERAVTERRLEQGMEYLQEKGLRMEQNNDPLFTLWVRNDVLIEEKMDIEEAGIDKKFLCLEVGRIAHEYFLERLQSSEV
ncbi:MAG: hypothetical protein M1820_001097 [Bogoriella megaspora]|nr:MAG: hypothetical protein M1820_001097 [Bogoriella megaspora]